MGRRNLVFIGVINGGINGEGGGRKKDKDENELVDCTTYHQYLNFLFRFSIGKGMNDCE